MSTTQLIDIPIGTRLKMTRAALAQRLDGEKLKCSAGIFKGQAYRLEKGVAVEAKDCIRVLRDGKKVTEIYHVKFWEPE